MISPHSNNKEVSKKKNMISYKICGYNSITSVILDTRDIYIIYMNINYDRFALYMIFIVHIQLQGHITGSHDTVTCSDPSEWRSSCNPRSIPLTNPAWPRAGCKWANPGGLAGYLPHTRSNSPFKWEASSGSKVQDPLDICTTCSSRSEVGEEGAEAGVGAMCLLHHVQHLQFQETVFLREGGQDIGRAPVPLHIALLGAFWSPQHSSGEPQSVQVSLLSSPLGTHGSPGNLLGGRCFLHPNTSGQGGVIHHPSFSCLVGSWKAMPCWWASFWIAESQGHWSML